MKLGVLVVACILLSIANPYAAGSTSNASWVGVWQGTLDGLPSVTLTLAEAGGELGGTLVLNIIERTDGSPRVVASQPHLLVHLKVEGNTLSFQVKRIDRSAKLMTFTVALGPAGKASIHCLNCGSDAPVVEMVKAA